MIKSADLNILKPMEVGGGGNREFLKGLSGVRFIANFYIKSFPDISDWLSILQTIHFINLIKSVFFFF